MNKHQEILMMQAQVATLCSVDLLLLSLIGEIDVTKDEKNAEIVEQLKKLSAANNRITDQLNKQVSTELAIMTSIL